MGILCGGLGVAQSCMHKSTSKYISTVLFDVHLCDDIIRCQNDKIDPDRIHFDMYSAKPSTSNWYFLHFHFKTETNKTPER